MNMSAFMNAMSNPQGYVMQQFANQMIAENPDKWQQCQQMFANKNRKQQIAELTKLYKSKGMDLNAVAKQYGITL
ncbi:MAG: hypothetical protein J6P07_05030 [Spirochaetaceae bacterium]|nr:hypothetical protein [Spirochaetaceae bacterium]MBO7731918.1 hypothetical protein [Methanobrevibacter sp.]